MQYKRGIWCEFQRKASSTNNFRWNFSWPCRNF